MTFGSQGAVEVGVDIGGTFTDLCIKSGGRVAAVGKCLTTPSAPADGVEAVIRETLGLQAIDASSVTRVVHATTLVTNALIERKGARTALLTTAGFRDVLELRRERRADLYDVSVDGPRPLIPRHLRFDVPERTLSDGSVEEELDEAHVERLARELAARGIEAVAVVFLHSFANPRNERAARDAIRRAAPELQVGISSEVVPEVREYPRTTTTAASVYVQSRVAGYLDDLCDRLQALGCDGAVRIMLSDGGVATVAAAAARPIRLLESGPAAGAIAAARWGTALGHPDLLSFDMGGTTAKLCMIEQGRPHVTHELEVDRAQRLTRGSGMPIRTPVVDMIEIGVGGGSLARVTPLGLLAVGPGSAGAEPGPACYGAGGTEPTITDADLVLGYLDPEYFLGGRMRLDPDAARRAVAERIAGPLGLSVEAAAWGIHRAANDGMAAAARVHAAERGLSPAGLLLFAFGGAGPVHAAGVAAALGCGVVAVPPAAGVLSSVGVLAAPLTVDSARTRRDLLDDGLPARVTDLIAELIAEGEHVLADSGVAPSDIRHALSADMRYVGQGFEVEVPLPGRVGCAAEMRKRFEAAYERVHGRRGPDVAVEVISWRVVSRGPAPELRLEITAPDGAPSPIKGTRRAYFDGHGDVAAPVFDRYALSLVDLIEGPAIVEERESTTVVPPGATARLSSEGALLLTVGGSR